VLSQLVGTGQNGLACLEDVLRSIDVAVVM
jgi:hypothetical protein